MLFDILHTISDFVVLLTRLMTEDLADEQRMVLIDQHIYLQGTDDQSVSSYIASSEIETEGGKF